MIAASVAALLVPTSGASAQTAQAQSTQSAAEEQLPAITVETTAPKAKKKKAVSPQPQPAPAEAEPEVAGEGATEDQQQRTEQGIGGVTDRSGGVDGYLATRTTSGTKTSTPLINVPQSITVVTPEQARDQGSEDVGDALQYVPGVTVGQGEGHRDQITIRGQNTTSDFYVNGVRDDIQYYRDLYNVDRLEVLKGPNAMIFGRGGGGGVVNRVTKEADGTTVRDATVDFGMYDTKRTTLDVGQAVTDDFAVRLNAMYEDSESFRDFFWLERYGINPTLAFEPDDNTKVSLSYEYFNDNRFVDRGIPSQNGRPSNAPIEQFFGNPNVNYMDFNSHVATATIEHKTDFGVEIRNHTSYGDYFKFYQNTQPNQAVQPANTVRLEAYNSTTERESMFNQTDLSYRLDMGGGITHTLLAGVEVGYQETDQFRLNGRFGSPVGPTTTIVPFSNPVTTTPVFFNILQGNALNHTELGLTGVYVQDQLEITRYLQIIGGLRFDRFDLDYTNEFDGTTRGRVDDVWSPRLGVVFKPFDALSLYASYSKSFLPFSGDQFQTLSAAQANLEPEEFINHEIGFKWEVANRLFLTGALYTLDRANQLVTSGPSSGTQVGLTRTDGGEVGLTGYVTDDWQVTGGYGYQVSEVVEGNSAGNEVPLVPHHTFSLWNRYQFTPMWGAGIGVVHRTDMFAELNNAVVIPGYTRVDAAVFFDLDKTWSAQVNVENILNEHYYATAHNNNNISPGAPTSVYLGVKASF